MTLACIQIISCASLKYPDWELVKIEPSVINKPCESKFLYAEYCDDEPCDDWFKKRATIYHANTVVKHKNNHASYFYCATGLSPYQNKTNKPIDKIDSSNKYEDGSERTKLDYKYESIFKSNKENNQIPKLNIKGLYIGMSKKAFDEKYEETNLVTKGFTVAGVQTKYSYNSPRVKFFEDRLDSFLFYFDSDEFENVLLAVKNKYPSISCKDSKVNNKMGAVYDQIICREYDANAVLSIERFAGNLDTSSLSLDSLRSIKEFKNKLDSNINDF